MAKFKKKLRKKSGSFPKPKSWPPPSKSGRKKEISRIGTPKKTG